MCVGVEAEGWGAARACLLKEEVEGQRWRWRVSFPTGLCARGLRARRGNVDLAATAFTVLCGAAAVMCHGVSFRPAFPT